MKLQKAHARLIKEIRKKFGDVIDLGRSPLVLVEILRQFGRRFADDDDGGGGMGGGGDDGVGGQEGMGGGGGVGGGGDDGGGGVGGGGGVSSIAVAGPPSAGDIEIAVVLKAILTLQKDVRAIGRKVDRMSPRGLPAARPRIPNRARAKGPRGQLPGG